MSTSVIITLIICTTILLLCITSEICGVLSKKYDHEHIMNSESEEK